MPRNKYGAVFLWEYTLMKIGLDVFGGDNAPYQILKGAYAALEAEKNLNLVLYGKADIIEADAKNSSVDMSRVEIVDAPDVISNDESPTMAVKTKKESSLVKGMTDVQAREDIDAFVTAGSTGAVLTAGIFKIGRIKGILRPALAPILPTIKGGNVCLIDCGANMDCKPEYLEQFAIMGSLYMQTVYGTEKPRVALLSVGVEDHKGNELTKAAFELLKQADINFVGNMEARDALSGDYDVLVTDGFAGNVLLKSTEGTAKMVMKLLKSSIKAHLSAKIGALFMKGAFNDLKAEMDYNSKGGAPLLGLNKVVVKSHGSSDAVSIKASILQAAAMAEGKLTEKIGNGIASTRLRD